MIQSVNKSNQVTGIRYEHADGSPALCAEGWTACERELDKKGRPVRLRYLDEHGAPVNIRAGYAEERYSWESGSVYVVSRFDASGSAVAMGNGYMAVRREIDGDDRVIRESWLDASGTAVKDGNGFSGFTYSYDGAGAVSGTAPVN